MDYNIQSIELILYIPSYHRLSLRDIRLELRIPRGINILQAELNDCKTKGITSGQKLFLGVRGDKTVLYEWYNDDMPRKMFGRGWVEIISKSEIPLIGKPIDVTKSHGIWDSVVLPEEQIEFQVHQALLVQETNKRGFPIEWFFVPYSKSKEVTEYEFTYRRIARCKQFCAMLQETPNFTAFIVELQLLDGMCEDVQVIDKTINNFDIKSSTKIYSTKHPCFTKASPFSNLSFQVRL
jgi:hypothetical protein